MKKRMIALLLGGLAFSIWVKAQDFDTIRIQRALGEIRLDGVLDEADWQRADMATGFFQNFPFDTSLALVQTEVRLTYDDQNLYIAARMSNKSRQREYVTPSLRRDFRGAANDAVVFTIDPFQDNTNAFQFGLNPFGVQREGLLANGGSDGDDLDLSWDNRWFSEARQYDGYWIAETAIPFKSIRFQEGSRFWNIKFYRIDSETGERSSWPRTPRQFPIMNLAYVGKLAWDAPPSRPGGNIAVIPYALTEYLEDRIDGQGIDRGFNVGGDAKVGLGPSLNLDLTFNPDFSQVEVDQQVTNLDRFEIFFPERRQFFLENADLFSSFGDGRMRPFFSRRIGVATNEETGENVQNSIYYGARLSGKVGNNLRVGFLNMQAARDLAVNQPTVNYTVATLQQKVFSRSNMGLIFVNKQPFEEERIVDSTGALFDYNRVVGFDYNLASFDNKWTGKFYFQHSFEPDQPVNSFATAANLSYNTLRWEAFTRAQWIGDNYNPETGFAPRVGYRRIATTARHRFYPKSGIINNHGPGFDFDVLGNPTDGITDWDINLLYDISFQNTANFALRLRREYVYLFDPFDPTNTEGLELPEGSDYAYNLIIARYSSDQRRAFFFELSTRSGGYFNGSRINLGGTVSYRFQPLGVLSIDFNFNRLRLPDPYNDADLVLIGPRLDLTFSKSLFWTTFIQFNNQIDNLNINSRLQWRFKPVSDLFIVYTDNYYPDTFESKKRLLVLKLTYWLNL